jgi:competence protein ComEA
MWRRRTSREDAAAAARRRLAAIAAEFDRVPVPARGSTPASPPSLHPTPDLLTTGSEGGRHRREVAASDGGRRRLSAQHLAVVALAVAALVTLAAWWALRSVPQADPVPLSVARSVPPPTGPLAGSTAPDPGTSPASTPTGGVPVSASAQSTGLVVDVAGKVRRPGIVELPAGSRVIDALAAAGGARPGVDTADLNLARPLVDGEQIVVGLDVPTAPPGSAGGAPPPVGSTAAAPASVDINTADQTELETLPGIGPVTAQSILAWRTENGVFSSVDQLLDVSGIGEATLADIEPYVHV